MQPSKIKNEIGLIQQFMNEAVSLEQLEELSEKLYKLEHL